MIDVTDVNHSKQNWESEIEMNMKLQDALCDDKNHYKQDESEMMLMFWLIPVKKASVFIGGSITDSTNKFL